MQYVNPKTTIKLGIVIFVLIIAISGLMLWKSGSLIRASGYQLIGEFSDVNGLLDGAEVRYRGYEVGRVLKVKPGPNKILVYFWVKTDVKIPKGSTVKVVFDGLIGEKFIAIAPNKNAKKVLDKGSVLQGSAGAGLSDFVDVGTQSLEQTRQILETFKNIIVQKDVTDAIKNTFLEIEQITQGLNEMVAELKKISSGDELQKIMVSLESVAISLKKTTDGLFEQGKVGEHIAKTTENLDFITTDFRKIMKEKNFADKLNRTLSNLDAISEDLKEFFSDGDLKGSLKDVFEGSSSIVQRVAEVDLDYEIGVNYLLQAQTLNLSKMSYEFFSDIYYKDKIFRIGYDDRFGESQTFHLQFGKEFLKYIWGRAGIMYSYPGIGLDYYILPNLSLSSNVYNFNNLSFELIGKYSFMDIISVNLQYSLDKIKGYSYFFGFTIGDLKKY